MELTAMVMISDMDLNLRLYVKRLGSVFSQERTIYGAEKGYLSSHLGWPPALQAMRLEVVTATA